MGAPQLNIKDPETTEIVRELAALTGESRTAVVRTAVREMLVRQRAQRDQEAEHRSQEKRREYERAWKEIKKIQAEVRRLGLAENMLTNDDLYDENGLPK